MKQPPAPLKPERSAWTSASSRGAFLRVGPAPTDDLGNATYVVQPMPAGSVQDPAFQDARPEVR